MADNSQKAKNRYQAVYDQKRLETQQAHQQTDLALQQQKGSVDQSFEKQLEQSIVSYRNAHSQAGRQSLRQGMQRSSYAAQTLGNILVAGNKAADEIGTNRTTALGNIEQQRSLLAQQLADQLKSFGSQQQSDELAYADDLAARDQQQANWLAEFNESVRQFNASLEAKGSSGGGGGGGGGGSSKKAETPAAALPSSNLNAILDGYKGGTGALTSASQILKNAKPLPAGSIWTQQKKTAPATKPGKTIQMKY